jgi:hypothetical protein
MTRGPERLVAVARWALDENSSLQVDEPAGQLHGWLPDEQHVTRAGYSRTGPLPT